MTSEKKGSKQKERKTCDYKMHNGKSCGRKLYDDEHCIFHSKDIEKKNEKFNDAFWKEFERQKEHEDIYDFKGFVFPGEISFEKKEFEKDTYFCRAKFSSEANFGGAKFSGEADSGAAQFASRTACFRETQFSGKAYFVEAKFPGLASFWGAQFSGVADFGIAKFDGEAYFFQAQFAGEAHFGGAQFAGEAHFNKARFKEDTNFENIEIEKNNNFEMIDTYFYNVSGLFEYIEENDKVFKKLRKRSKTLKTEFLPKNFKLILGEGVTARHPVQSRQIRDDMYLLDKKERISKMSGIKRIWNKSFYFLWWLTADYGRSFKRWLLCCFVIIRRSRRFS